MPYLYCRRCGLEIKIQAAFLRIENCPRCLARTATSARLALRDNDGARDFHGELPSIDPASVPPAHPTVRVGSETPRQRRPS
jgi:hypothetical protein